MGMNKKPLEIPIEMRFKDPIDPDELLKELMDSLPEELKDKVKLRRA